MHSQRGGAGNVGSPHTQPAGEPHDEDVIPEAALREDNAKPHHVGRGGAGNEYQEGEHKGAPGLADKLKAKILGNK